jgi:thiamine-phosphate pyrophosphorylase
VRRTLPRLLLLTDRSQLRLGRGLVQTVTECARAGLTHVVVREHDLAAAARTALVEALAGVPGLTVISSRIPESAAHGLHESATCAGVVTVPTPPAPCAATVTPRYMGRGELWGRSCHTRAEVDAAAAEGLDYVTLSPFAATPSKPGHGPALPRAAYADLPLPAYALGGITPANAAEARAAGAHGVAVMGAVMRAAEPASVVGRLLEEVR